MPADTAVLVALLPEIRLPAPAAVPGSVRESADLLGAGRLRRFLRIDLPLMRPGVTAGAGLVLLSTLKELPATLLLSLSALSASLSAAAQDVPAIIPVLASSELAEGPNRFLFSLTDAQGALLAAPDVQVQLQFYDDESDPEAVAFESGSRFLWAIEDYRGLYAADVVFPHAGRWGTRFNATFPDGRSETVRADYDVREVTSTPPIGSPAPVIDTPTAADVDGDLGYGDRGQEDRQWRRRQREHPQGEHGRGAHHPPLGAQHVAAYRVRRDGGDMDQGHR